MVFLNGFFVVAEYGLVRSRKSKLEELAELGEGGASLALKVLAKQETYVSAVQLGITASTVLLGILGGRFFCGAAPCSCRLGYGFGLGSEHCFRYFAACGVG